MDYNNDGCNDFLLGDYAGEAWLYTGSSSGLEAGVHLRANGGKINTTSVSSPSLVDWDEDGDLDLVIGGTNGSKTVFRKYMNNGSNPNELDFTTYTDLPFWNRIKATQQFYDLDMDGDKDIIFGRRDGKLSFAENTGTNYSPSFSSHVLISCVDGIIDIGNCAREFVCDWNEDGVPDLLVGSTTLDGISLYLGRNVGIEENEQVAIDNEKSFHLLCNPTSGFLSMSITTATPCAATLAVYDCAGRTVHSSALSLDDAVNAVDCDLTGCPDGFYQVVIDFGGSILSERIVLLR